MSPPEDRDAHDPAEIWGRRIGRGLGVVALAGLAYWLGRQLQVW
ncbi:hypothetical protein [Methylobacterium sp. SyP6R]|nr:hypothetical protein [Methylobacterium sp. SyP6R]